ncbi:hypothetical protein FI667_g4476, partial [Globisporangium splendens]
MEVEDDDEVALGEYHRDDGFQLSEQPIERMLQACAALEELHVLFWIQYRVPSSLQTCIKDDFCRSIAKNCPRLKKLLIDQNCTGFHETPLRVTDNGMVALSTLLLLQSIGLMQTRCTSKDILALILNASDPSYRRRIALQIGSLHVTPQVNFFDVAIDFLELLLEQPGDAFRGRMSDLEFIVHEKQVLEGHEATRAKLAELFDKPMKQHPYLDTLFPDSKENHEDVQDNMLDTVSISVVAPVWTKQSMINCFGTNWVDERSDNVNHWLA